MNDSSIMVGTIIIVFVWGASLYFVPSFTARGKKHRQGIAALNLFLGWTILGWVGALAWALSDPDRAQANAS